MVSFSLLSIDATMITFIALLVVLIVLLLVVPMFTNKKRAKQTEELHRSLQPGDLIKTVGGIIGTIKEIRQVSPADKEMVIETGEGDNKTTMVFDIAALYQVMSRSSSIVAAHTNDVEKDEKADTAQLASEEVAAPVVAEEKTVAAETEAKSEEPAAEAVADKAEETAVAEQAATTEFDKAEATTVAPKAATPAKKKPVNSAKKTAGGANSTKK